MKKTSYSFCRAHCPKGSTARQKGKEKNATDFERRGSSTIALIFVMAIMVVILIIGSILLAAVKDLNPIITKRADDEIRGSLYFDIVPDDDDDDDGTIAAVSVPPVR